MSDVRKKLEPYDAWAVSDSDELKHIGDRWYASQYSYDEPIPVRVREVSSEEERTHYGWVAKGRNGEWEDRACMVWSHKDLFDMCFPSGAEV